MTDAFDRALLYLTDLRFRVRHSADAKALVDRCLALLMASRTSDPEALAALEVEFEEIRAELEARFGVRTKVTTH